MRRRLLPHVCMLITLLAWSSDAAAKPATSWAQAEPRAVVAAGLMAKETAARPQDSLTRGELETISAGLLHVVPTATTAASTTVTMSGLDAKLVSTLGLTDSAGMFTEGAKVVGLTPPSRFGNEVVARLLGLRTNHPAKQDSLELLPGDPATRAEAAYSAARILSFTGDETQLLEDAAATFAIPPLSSWQKRILTTAFSFVGYPYVWGGASEGPESLFGVDSRGGFDCSGFVWRVYKLQRYPDGGALAATLKGRTAAQMSREVPPAERIPLSDLQPGDVLFFGANGPRSKPVQVDHAGIYVGSGWFVHSSRYGVALAQLDGWYLDRFAWARRPLAEAGLSV